MTSLARFLMFLTLFVAGVAPYSSHSENLSKVEFSYLYKDSPVKMRYKMAEKDGTYKLLMYFDLKKVTQDDDVRNLELVSQKKFTSTKDEPIEPLTQYASREQNSTTYDLTFQVNPEHSYLVVKLDFLANPYIFDIPIGEALAYPLPDFIFKGAGIDRPVVRNADSLVFEKMGRGAGKYFGYLYKDHFSPSYPAFSDDVPDANKRFVIEEIDPTNYGYKVPRDNYLYYFQNDTTSQKGVYFYSHKEYFPNTKEFEELIGPLIYIATENEFNKLESARDKKKAFDDFWLSLIPSQKLAARTLRNYFRRVKQANAVFTNYKNGWKTDMGMIYILYGPPDRVFKDDDAEIWEYSNFDGRVKFSFSKVPNLFTQYHYSLDRSKSYTSEWFSQVERWRKGDS